MSSFRLRIIAMATMVADHTAYAFMFYMSRPAYYTMRGVGRLAMPIFCFLIAEGFLHTKDIKKYLGRLLLFGIISEVPFDLLFSARVLEFERGQNVFFTLFLGLLAVSLFDRLARQGRMGPGFLCVALCTAAAFVFRTDYQAFGVLFIFAFYYFRGKRGALVFVIAVITGSLALSQYIGGNPTFALVSLAELLALPLILMYNGQPGPTSKGMRMSFYIFYPLHLSMILLCALYVGRVAAYFY